MSLLGLLGIAYFTLGGKNKVAVGIPLAAIGEGESREDFVRVEGTQVSLYFIITCRTKLFSKNTESYFVYWHKIYRAACPTFQQYLCGKSEHNCR